MTHDDKSNRVMDKKLGFEYKRKITKLLTGKGALA